MPATLELKRVRKRCEKMGISWHPRHKVETLEAVIRSKTKARDERLTDPEVKEVAKMETAQELQQETRDFMATAKEGDFSQEMRNRALEALGRLNGAGIAPCSAVREYIQLLEAKLGIE